MDILTAKNIQAGYNRGLVIDQLAVNFKTGKVTSLIGPNGCGKSTLLKSLARILPQAKGEIFLKEKPIQEYANKELAKQMTMLAQNSEGNLGITVEDLVSYGRFPYQKPFQGLTKADQEKIDWALEVTDIVYIKERPLADLSGGQRQRAWIAMALAQDTEVLLLDEPTTFLDPAHQLEVLDLLQSINRDSGKTIIMSIHDMNLASRFSDEILGMKAGKILVQGTPEEVLTPKWFRTLFEIEAEIVKDPHSMRPLLLSYDLLSKGGAGDEK